MKNLVDIEMPLFILIDEIKNGNLKADDITKNQLNSLPPSVREIAESNR